MAEPSGQAPKPPKVSALVVSYNRKDLLRRALEALERSEARDTIEIVVVDNGSTDGSQELEAEFPRARFIRIPRNFGLTKALNLGVRGSEAEYVFFLHEDTEVFPETARLLAALLDCPTGRRARSVRCWWTTKAALRRNWENFRRTTPGGPPSPGRIPCRWIIRAAPPS